MNCQVCAKNFATLKHCQAENRTFAVEAEKVVHLQRRASSEIQGFRSNSLGFRDGESHFLKH